MGKRIIKKGGFYMLEHEIDKILVKVYDMEMSPYVAKQRILKAVNKSLKKDLNGCILKLEAAINGES